MKVRITSEAEADLEAIADWIANDSPSRALSFNAELRDACLTLANLPAGYPVVPRYERFAIRRRVYGNYLIFYRVVERTVEVLHVLHGARDYEAILFPDG